MCEMFQIDGIFTGEHPLPTMGKEEDEKAFAARRIYWETANKFIEGKIRCSITSDGLAHIAGVSGAYNMVERLNSIYKGKGYSSRDIPWWTISRTTMRDYTSMIEYVEAIRNAKTSLAKFGYEIPGWIVTTSFLQGLPSCYESFVEIILNVRWKDINGNPMEPDFDEMCVHLLDLELRRKIMAESFKNCMTLKSSNLSRVSGLSGDQNKKTRPLHNECDATRKTYCLVAHTERTLENWTDHNKNSVAELSK